MDILGDAENPTLHGAQLKMNPRVTPHFLEIGFSKNACFPRDFKNGCLGRC